MKKKFNQVDITVCYLVYQFTVIQYTKLFTYVGTLVVV